MFKIDNLCYRYKKTSPYVLDGVSLELEKGEMEQERLHFLTVY